MTIQQVMTPHVEMVDPNSTLQEAASKMKSRDIGSLPVGENDRLVGMLTDRDITIRAIAEGLDPTKTIVRKAMTSEMIYCFQDQTLPEAAKLMEEHKVRRLVVLDRNKRLVGICSLGDLVMDDKTLAGEVLHVVTNPEK